MEKEEEAEEEGGRGREYTRHQLDRASSHEEEALESFLWTGLGTGTGTATNMYGCYTWRIWCHCGPNILHDGTAESSSRTPPVIFTTFAQSRFDAVSSF